MPLIKDSKLTKDRWVTVAEGEAIPVAENVIVSLEDWQSARNELMCRNGRLGIRLRSDQSPAFIAEDLAEFDVIALEFPAFKDGRAFSYARLLRERYGFKGEIRAVGDVLRDQFLFMQRCGFDAFEVKEGTALEAWFDALSETSVWYQPAADLRRPAFSLRQARRAAQRAKPAILDEEDEDDVEARICNDNTDFSKSPSLYEEPAAVEARAAQRTD